MITKLFPEQTVFVLKSFGQRAWLLFQDANQIAEFLSREVFADFHRPGGTGVSMSFICKLFAKLTEENGIHFVLLMFNSLCF